MGINNMEWIDKEEWRRKRNLKAQKDVKTLNIKNNNNHYSY